MKDIIGNAREEKNAGLMAEFKEWISERFGRDIVAGDRFKLSFPDGGSKIVTVSNDEYVIDFGRPVLDTTGAEYNLGRDRLKKYKAELK